MFNFDVKNFSFWFFETFKTLKTKTFQQTPLSSS